ncbi:hypothetical protein [Ochrobactrum sp. 3-3]|uniref:hypothetical protein n=1 Tax=Ochrobactrum sp. 3-3 TaxID=1830124 RepID=UPI000DEFCE6D|nr:hypothetical protein [Ochrobactrum sp. 3-3]
MASELKPWRYEIKYGPDGEDSYSWVYDDHGAMVATMKTHKAKEVVDRMNSRPAPVDANLLASNPVDDKIAPDTDDNAPAATDTGLVTYAHDNGTLSGLSRNEHGPWCLRSQAEELLAAERARYVEASQRATNEESLKDTMHRGLLRWKERAEKAEADNAAKDAEISAIAGHLDCEPDSGSILHTVREIEADKAIYKERAEALEAKLAAAEKALEPFAKIPVSTVPEGRLGHVPDKHPYMVDLDGNVLFTASDIRKARAVLGGKP